MPATPVILRYPDRLSLHHLIPLTLPSSYSRMALPHAPFEGTDIDRTRSRRGAMTLGLGKWLVYVTNESKTTYAEGETCIFSV